MITDQVSIGLELPPGVVLKLTRVILLVPVIAEGELLECSWPASKILNILQCPELSCIAKNCPAAYVI